MLVYRDISGKCITVLLGSTSYNFNGVILNDYDNVTGPDGTHTQWSSIPLTLDEAPPGALGIVPFTDHFGHNLFRSVARLGPVGCAFAFGVSKIGASRDIKIDTYISTQKYKDIIDIQPHNIYSTLRGLLEPFKGFRYERDKIVTHFNGAGVILPKYEPSDEVHLIDDTYGPFGLPVRRYDLTAYDVPYFHLYGYSNTPNFDPDNVVPVNNDQYGNNVDIIDTLRLWKANLPDLRNSDFSRYRALTMLSLDYSVTDNRIDAYYKFESTEYSVDLNPAARKRWRSVWDVHFGIGFRPSGMAQNPVGGLRALDGLMAFQEYSYRLVEGQHESGSGKTYRYTSFTPYSGYLNQHSPPLKGWAGTVTNIPVNVDPVQLIQNEVRRHGQYFHSIRQHLIPSNIYSFNNAVAAKFEVLENNYLEVLSELGDLPELVPDVESLLRSLAYARKFDPRALVKLGDFIAGNHLRYAFGISPSVSVVRELNERSERIRRAFDDDLVPSIDTRHGAFFYTFQKGEVKYKDSILQTVTTVDMEYSESAFTKAITTLYGFRVLPNLQNVWEVLPFSFAADWFSGMSSRLGAIDTTVLSLMVRLQGLNHSYTVTTPGTSSPVLDAAFDMSNAVFKYYRRDVTKHVPSLLIGSKFDFLSAGGAPGAILASLVFQLGK